MCQPSTTSQHTSSASAGVFEQGGSDDRPAKNRGPIPTGQSKLIGPV